MRRADMDFLMRSKVTLTWEGEVTVLHRRDCLRSGSSAGDPPGRPVRRRPRSCVRANGPQGHAQIGSVYPLPPHPRASRRTYLRDTRSPGGAYGIRSAADARGGRLAARSGTPGRKPIGALATTSGTSNTSSWTLLTRSSPSRPGWQLARPYARPASQRRAQAGQGCSTDL